jgi:predicted alpha/beta hydrolase family esterase
MKILILLFFVLSNLGIKAQDRTKDYERFLNLENILSQNDIKILKNVEIILVPGIVAESFILRDHRSRVDFSILFKEYFGAQLEHYSKLKLNVARLKTSSRSKQETILSLELKALELKKKNRPGIFITHSLGGLVVLDWLQTLDKKTRSLISGVVFLQSPFYGSPVADLYLENPYFIRSVLGPVIPFLNVSTETVEYLSVAKRKKIMRSIQDNLPEIFRGIPVLTAGGMALNGRSLFTPTLNLFSYGCLIYRSDTCLGPVLYQGPYENSDGLVGLSSSRLPGVERVDLVNVDHGETVLQMPRSTVDRVRVTDALLKLILKQIDK